MKATPLLLALLLLLPIAYGLTDTLQPAKQGYVYSKQPDSYMLGNYICSYTEGKCVSVAGFALQQYEKIDKAVLRVTSRYVEGYPAAAMPVEISPLTALSDMTYTATDTRKGVGVISATINPLITTEIDVTAITRPETKGYFIYPLSKDEASIEVLSVALEVTYSEKTEAPPEEEPTIPKPERCTLLSAKLSGEAFSMTGLLRMYVEGKDCDGIVVIVQLLDESTKKPILTDKAKFDGSTLYATWKDTAQELVPGQSILFTASFEGQSIASNAVTIEQKPKVDLYLDKKEYERQNIAESIAPDDASSALAICDASKTDKEFCYLKVARATRDDLHCIWMDSDAARDNCYLQLGIKNNDIQTCTKINKQSYETLCSLNIFVGILKQYGEGKITENPYDAYIKLRQERRQPFENILYKPEPEEKVKSIAWIALVVMVILVWVLVYFFTKAKKAGKRVEAIEKKADKK